MRTPISSAFAALVVGLRPLIDSRAEASQRPFDGKPAAVPHADSKMWAWTHFGVFLPLLPAPYRYLNTMTLIGATGTEIFDNDDVVRGDARHTSTVLSSTAHGDQTFYRAYGTGECDFVADGSSLAWGDELRLDVNGSAVTLAGRYGSFDVDVELRVTDQVSYFVRTPVYQHWSRLAEYSGTVRDESGATSIGGLGTFEYARAASPQALVRRPLPEALKLPADFFTYQIVAIDEETQILLTDVRVRGRMASRLAHVRRLEGAAEIYEDVDFEVASYGPSLVDPSGRDMRVPHEIRWVVRDNQGVEMLTLEGTVDSPLRFGHGRGYAGAYSYRGSLRGEAVGGSAYIEWVDVRPHA